MTVSSTEKGFDVSCIANINKRSHIDSQNQQEYAPVWGRA